MVDPVIAKSPSAERMLLQQQHVEKMVLTLQITHLLSRCKASLSLLHI